MDISTAKLRKNAVLLYSVILTLGIVLSAFVYLSSAKVEQNTLNLVENEIPILDQLKQLDSSFNQQEHFLYEYYATQNRNLFSESFRRQSQTTNRLIETLRGDLVGTDKEITRLKEAQEYVIKMANEFDKNMDNSGFNVDWDLARDQLRMFTELRRNTKPLLDQIATDTKQRVTLSYYDTRRSLKQTSYLVLAYSVLILFIAVVIGRYSKRYVDVSVNNKRLALFPLKNPNPIISIDQQDRIVFSNPATDELLSATSLSIDEFFRQIKKTVKQQQKQIFEQDHIHQQFELKLQNKTLSCYLHWLKEMSTWDLHIIDVTSEKQAEAKLNFQAFHEIETGLYNKNKLLEQVNEFCNLNAEFALGEIELRHYSQLVSRLGLEQARQTFTELALFIEKLIKQKLQNQEHMLFHMSDKQLSLLFQSSGCKKQLSELVNFVERNVEQHSFCGGVHVELDFGFACYPEHASDANSLVKCVNIALEKAVNTDHSSLVIYHSDLGDKIHKEICLTNALRHAIDASELQLHFQPQLNIQNDQIVGLETLIRWPTDEGFISPAEFIPLAEKSGLIIPLGKWILETACHQAKTFIDSGYPNLVVAINISPQQFQQPNFLNTVEQALLGAQVPPENIELEITEGVIMYNEKDTIELLNKLKNLGLKLSIDDFGTGYSSLSYLKQFPIDKLKIDQSFIFKLDESSQDRAIVNTIIDLGTNLNLTLIAEGVETESNIHALKKMGCQEIQGYFFSRPLPIDKLTEFLKEYKNKQDQVMTVAS